MLKDCFLFLRKGARLLQWLDFFVRPQSSPCMYLFLVQTLICLAETQRLRVRVPASVSNFSVHLQNRKRLKGPPFDFFSALCAFFENFFVSKESPFNFLMFCNKVEFQKAQRVLFTFSGTMRLFQSFHFLSEIRFSQYIPTINFLKYYPKF